MNADASVDVSKILVISFILSFDHSFFPCFIFSISTILSILTVLSILTILSHRNNGSY